MIMKKIIQVLLLLSLSNSLLADENFPEINEFWLQAAPPNAKVMAAYGTLTNQSKDDMVLVDAYSPAFSMTMIHQTKIVDGVAKMLHQDELVIKPNEQLVFKPGSFHIMLMHPNFKIITGDRIKINLIYKVGDKRQVQEMWFPVEKK